MFWHWNCDICTGFACVHVPHTIAGFLKNPRSQFGSMSEFAGYWKSGRFKSYGNVKFGCWIIARHYAIMRHENMLKICLEFEKPEPYYINYQKFPIANLNLAHYISDNKLRFQTNLDKYFGRNFAKFFCFPPILSLFSRFGSSCWKMEFLCTPFW